VYNNHVETLLHLVHSDSSTFEHCIIYWVKSITVLYITELLPVDDILLIIKLVEKQIIVAISKNF